MKTAELIGVLKCCAAGKMEVCEKECPVYGEKWDTETCNRVMAEAADRLGFMESLKGSRLELARMYWVVVAERDRLREEVSDLRKHIEALNEVSEDWRCVAENMCAKLKVARAERNAARAKLARITGEREAAWLQEVPDV